MEKHKFLRQICNLNFKTIIFEVKDSLFLPEDQDGGVQTEDHDGEVKDALVAVLGVLAVHLVELVHIPEEVPTAAVHFYMNIVLFIRHSKK